MSFFGIKGLFSKKQLDKKVEEYAIVLDDLFEKRKLIFETTPINVLNLKDNNDKIRNLLSLAYKEIFRSKEYRSLKKELISANPISSRFNELNNLLTFLKNTFSFGIAISKNISLQQDLIKNNNFEENQLRNSEDKLVFLLNNESLKYYPQSDKIKKSRPRLRFAFSMLLFLTASQIFGAVQNNSIIIDKSSKLQSEFVIKNSKVAVTFYDDSFEGKITTKGTVFSQNKFTCAVPIGSLLLGKYIQITNPNNNKTIVVKAIDVGNFGFNEKKNAPNKYLNTKVGGNLVIRGFDLSKVAYNYLGFKDDVGVVSWTVVDNHTTKEFAYNYKKDYKS